MSFLAHNTVSVEWVKVLQARFGGGFDFCHVILFIILIRLLLDANELSIFKELSVEQSLIQIISKFSYSWLSIEEMHFSRYFSELKTGIIILIKNNLFAGAVWKKKLTYKTIMVKVKFKCLKA